MDQLSVWGSGDKAAEKCHPIKQMGSDALTVQPRAKKTTKTHPRQCLCLKSIAQKGRATGYEILPLRPHSGVTPKHPVLNKMCLERQLLQEH